MHEGPRKVNARRRMFTGQVIRLEMRQKYGEAPSKGHIQGLKQQQNEFRNSRCFQIDYEIHKVVSFAFTLG